jgi:hypothetical protein
VTASIVRFTRATAGAVVARQVKSMRMSQVLAIPAISPVEAAAAVRESRDHHHRAVTVERNIAALREWIDEFELAWHADGERS